MHQVVALAVDQTGPTLHHRVVESRDRSRALVLYQCPKPASKLSAECWVLELLPGTGAGAGCEVLDAGVLGAGC